ncbi:prephenate dehydrogenase/arogenate dehydrogenase family protein [soil metagenome]
MLFDTITIVGVGLIGGSIGLAAKARGVARSVVGVGRNAEVLELAVKLGAIDRSTTDSSEGFAAASLVIVCTPVNLIADVILKHARFCNTGTIITDAGSTKANISTQLCGNLPAGVMYVGSHPLAGSEKSGVEHSTATLFDAKTAIVTTDDAAEADIETVATFWRHLGSKVIRMTTDEHDRAVAFTSHLPHAVAAAVAASLPPQWLPLAASGFKDTTRVAGGDVAMWDAIFQSNRVSVLAAAERFASRFNTFRELLAAGDAAGLYRWLDEGKQVRDALGS